MVLNLAQNHHSRAIFSWNSLAWREPRGNGGAEEKAILILAKTLIRDRVDRAMRCNFSTVSLVFLGVNTDLVLFPPGTRW